VNALLQRGARVDCLDDEGATPLHAAVARGADDVMHTLLLPQHAACWQVVDKKGRSPLVLALQQKRTDAAASLLRAGVSIGCAPRTLTHALPPAFAPPDTVTAPEACAPSAVVVGEVRESGGGACLPSSPTATQVCKVCPLRRWSPLSVDIVDLVLSCGWCTLCAHCRGVLLLTMCAFEDTARVLALASQLQTEAGYSASEVARTPLLPSALREGALLTPGAPGVAALKAAVTAVQSSHACSIPLFSDLDCPVARAVAAAAHTL
ncbi:ankyrin repeat domain-containing protein, partial [archaeon]